MTGLEGAGFDHFAISLFASRPGRYGVKSLCWPPPSLVCDCGNREAISKPGGARRQLQASVSVEITDRGGRKAALLASTAQATRAILLASATAAMLV